MADLERALLILSSSEYFSFLIPEVMSNIAVAIPGAKNIYDVAAVPGRISRSKTGGILYRRPEFGATRHLGGILLSINGRFRAVMNIKYDELVRESLISMGVFFKEFSSEQYPSANPAASAAADLLDKYPDCRALIDVGGPNIESVVYLFGNRAVEVANTAVLLGDLYYAVSLKHGKDLSNL
jgi:predicted fused transcriptional regulator/phosphomethylpyrimidine kinase